MPRKQVVKVHISKIGGEWYAMAGNNNSATRSALVPAIDYCNRMNETERRARKMKGQQA